MICRRVPQGIEEPPAPVGVPPPLRVHPLDVQPHVQKVSPFLRGELRRILGARDMRLPAVGEFQLGPFAAIGAVDEQDDSVRHRRRGGLVDEVAVAEAFDRERCVDGMGLVAGNGMSENVC